MAKIAVHKEGSFTIVHNHPLRNENISYKAKGLLVQMLSLPPNWDYTEYGLARIARDGRASVHSAIKELEEAGYLVRSVIRDDAGKIIDTQYDVYEIPMAGSQEGGMEKYNTGQASPNTSQPAVTKTESHAAAYTKKHAAETTMNKACKAGTGSIRQPETEPVPQEIFPQDEPQNNGPFLTEEDSSEAFPSIVNEPADDPFTRQEVSPNPFPGLRIAAFYESQNPNMAKSQHGKKPTREQPNMAITGNGANTGISKDPDPEKTTMENTLHGNEPTREKPTMANTQHGKEPTRQKPVLGIPDFVENQHEIPGIQSQKTEQTLAVEPYPEKPDLENPSLENPDQGFAVSGEPYPENPELGFPALGNPAPGNRQQLNTILLNTKQVRIYPPPVRARARLEAGTPPAPAGIPVVEEERIPTPYTPVSEVRRIAESASCSKSPIRIGGADVPPEELGAVFGHVTDDDVRTVADLISSSPDVRNRQAYIRTALWNEVAKRESAKPGTSPVRSRALKRRSPTTNAFCDFEQRDIDIDQLEVALLRLQH